MTKKSDERGLLMLFGGCVIAFVLAWSKFLLPALPLYLFDYAFRMAIIVVIVRAVGLKPFSDRVASPWLAGLLTIVVWYVALIVEQITVVVFPWEPLFMNWLFPRIDDPMLRWSDAVLGVALVAMSEELVFRYLPARIGANREWSSLKIYIVSTATFALIHAPQGIVRIAEAAIFGVAAMALYRRHNSIWPPLAAHYAINLVLFSDFACGMNVRPCG